MKSLVSEQEEAAMPLWFPAGDLDLQRSRTGILQKRSEVQT